MALTKVKASNITLTTAAANSNDTTPATTAYVTTAIANLVDGAPATLNTLDEIAAALNDDAALNTTLTNAIAAKLPLAGGTLTGNLNISAGAADVALTVRNSASGTSASDGLSITVENPTPDVAIRQRENANMKFYTNNTERMRITSAGDVTIRSGEKLIINRDDNATGGEITYGPTGTGFIFNDANGDGIDFKVGSTMLMSIDSTNQRVGIGKPSPAYSLDVVGPGTSNGVTLNLTDAASSANSKHLLLTRGSNTAIVGVAGSQVNDPLWISRSGGYDLMVASSGNVGIGATSPSKPLHLKTSSGWATMRLEGASDSGGELEFYKGSTKAGGIFFDNSNNLNIRTGNTPVFFIDAVGNLTGTMINATNGEYDGNLDNLKKTGFYRSKNSNTNNPSYAYYSVVVYGNQGNVTAQIATLLAGPATYVRSFNTSWTSWVRIDD